MMLTFILRYIFVKGEWCKLMWREVTKLRDNCRNFSSFIL